MVIIMIFKSKLKEIRGKKEQKDIAKILNIAESTYCDYENNNEIIPIKHINTLCNTYNISFDYFFNLNETKNYKNSHSIIDRKVSGERLKKFRKENNIKQKDLINFLKIGYGTFSGYENGHFLISTHALYSICKKYNISADYLLGKTDSPKYLN